MEKTTEKSNHQNCHTWVIQTRHIISIMGMFGNILVLAKLTYRLDDANQPKKKKMNCGIARVKGKKGRMSITSKSSVLIVYKLIVNI